MKIVRENLFEVLRSEDTWANQEIDKYQEKFKKPGEKLNPYQIRYDTEKEKILSHIKYLEEYIWENSDPQKMLEWEDYKNSFGELKELSEDELQEIYMKASIIVNELKHKSY